MGMWIRFHFNYPKVDRININGVVEGNKEQDSVCEEYAEDHFCNEDGRFSQASQGSVCHRQQAAV